MRSDTRATLPYGYLVPLAARLPVPDTSAVRLKTPERFCIIGPPETHIARLRELADLGVGHFGLYLQHDAQDATLAAYGNAVIPFVGEHLQART